MSTHVSIKKLLILLAATLMMLPAISANDNHNFDTNICLPQEKCISTLTTQATIMATKYGSKHT